MLNRIFPGPGFSLERFRSLYEVAEAGGITRAAGGSSSRQSLISRHLSELESSLNVPLLDRTSRPHQLTVEAIELSQVCRDFFQGIEDCKTRWEGAAGEISIATGESLLQWVVMPLVKRRKLCEDGQLRLAFQNLKTQAAVQRVADGRADLALVRRNAVPRSLMTGGDFEFRYQLVVPKEIMSSSSGKIGFEQLASMPMALMEGEGEFSQIVERETRSRGIDLDVRLLCSSFTQVSEAISTMGLAGFLPQFAPPIAGTQRIDLPELEPLRRELTLAWSARTAKQRPLLDSFIKKMLN